MKKQEIVEHLIESRLPEEYRFQAKITNHPIIRDAGGVIRYKQNGLIAWLHDSGGLDLNAMRVAYQYGAFALSEYMQFYRDMGYSLAGFGEVFGDELAEMETKQP